MQPKGRDGHFGCHLGIHLYPLLFHTENDPKNLGKDTIIHHSKTDPLGIRVRGPSWTPLVFAMESVLVYFRAESIIVSRHAKIVIVILQPLL